jgi:NAD(P)-dependent dehydrogenase (short-subunit alcohol dehydrogenase family)
MALGLAAAGASVAVVARSADQLAETVALVASAGGRAVALPADVSDPRAVEAMVRATEQQLGPVDLLVNNAGIPGPFGPINELDPAQWWRCHQVNLLGPFLCARALLPSMITRRRGRIVNVASGAGTQAIAYLSAYVVSKTALIRWTEVLATEVAEHGIKTFAIEPGTVRTAMADWALNSDAGRKWLPWFRDIFEQGRNVPPDHAVGLLLLLASGKADALSGRFFTVADDIPGLVDRVERGPSGELQTLRLITT